ncbi:MAG: adenylate/guanylate cyclase domain-containing protein [Alphaproteobacteria bacterium]
MPGTRSDAQEALLARSVVWATRAVLLIDVVESVRLIEQDEVSAVSRWLAFVEHVKTGILPECKGRVVKSLGDGLLLDFDDVRAAVAAAFAIQHASNRANSGLPAERQMHLRMGLEVSDVIVEPDDVHGRGVNLAARLMTLARPGEIVISAHARDQLTPDLDADIEDLGECYVRHLRDPVRAYRIGPLGPRPLILPGMRQDDIAPTIAVVPFAARSAPAEHDILGEVLAEEIIRALSHTSELNVISRLSTTAFRRRQVTLAEISAHLNADYVLSGVYSTDGQTVSLDAELAEAKSGRIVWTDRLKDQVSGILSGEPKLIGRVIAQVAAAIITRELQRSQSQPLPTLKAYTLVLGAIALMHRGSLPDFEQARHLLQTLIDRGARHAIPQAWMANWHVLRLTQGWSLDARQDGYLALECTKRALDSDPNCSLALAIDGFVHTNLLKRLDVARDRYDLALLANPSNALAWLLRGTLAAFTDEGQSAVDDTQRALQLSPLDPQRYFYDSLAASACITARQFDRALELAQRSLRANRRHTSTLRVKAVAQWQLGRHDEARATAKELLTLEPTLTVGRWLERSPSAPYKIGKEFAEVLRQVGVPN